MKGKLFKEKYHVLRTLGQNTFSETFLAKDRSLFSHHRYVIKRFRPILGNPQVRETKRLFYQEASVLKRLSGKNPQIPQLYEYCMEGEDFYLVREWIRGITLEQKIQQQGRLPETEVQDILSSILAVLQYIHSYGIVYRALKPSSIVLRQRTWFEEIRGKDPLPVPIYFDGVKELAAEKTGVVSNHNLILANQHEYISPEQEQGKSVYASDLYSLGLTAIYLLTAKTPAELELDSYTNQIMWQKEAPELKTNLVRVIERAICPHPHDRFTSAPEMLQALHSELVLISESLIYQPAEKSVIYSEIKVISILFLLGLGVIGIVFSLLNFDATQLQLIKNDSNFELELEEISQ